jgi:hypothetical protein
VSEDAGILRPLQEPLDNAGFDPVRRQVILDDGAAGAHPEIPGRLQFPGDAAAVQADESRAPEAARVDMLDVLEVEELREDPPT